MPNRRNATGTRTRIERAALTEFTERGYDASTLEGVASRVGMTRQALLYHYRSKEALLRSIVEPAFHDMEATLECLEAGAVSRGVGHPPTAHERRQILGRLVETSCAHRGAFALVTRFANQHTVLDLGPLARNNTARVGRLLAGDAFESDRATRIRVVACMAALGGTIGARLDVALDTPEDRDVLVDALGILLASAA